MNIRQWRSLGKRDLFSRVNEPNAALEARRFCDVASEGLLEKKCHVSTGSHLLRPAEYMPLLAP
jgi:hypothetical protein